MSSKNSNPKKSPPKNLISPTSPISDIIKDIQRRSYECDFNIIYSNDKGFIRKLKFFRFLRNQIMYNPKYGTEVEFLMSFGFSMVGYETSQDDLITEGLLKPAEDYETVRIDL